MGLFSDHSEAGSKAPYLPLSKYRGELTVGGFTLDIVKSGFQKSIRRSLPDKAARYVTEMASVSMAEDHPERIKAVQTNLLHRLMIIYLEDVGLADPGLLLYLAPLAQRVKELNLAKPSTSRRRETVDTLVAMTHALAASKHSRALSHFKAVFDPAELRKKKAFAAACPEFAGLYDGLEEDVATALDFGLKPGEEALEAPARNLLGCLEEGSDRSVYWALKIIRSDVKVSRYRCRKPVYLVLAILEEFISLLPPGLKKVYARLFSVVAAWWKELQATKEGILAPLFLVLLAAKRAQVPVSAFAPGAGTDALASRVCLEAFTGAPFEPDPWVVDMHTKKGRAAGKGGQTFRDEGAVVSDEGFVVELYRAFYNACPSAKALARLGTSEVRGLGTKGATKGSGAAGKLSKEGFARELETAHEVLKERFSPRDAGPGLSMLPCGVKGMVAERGCVVESELFRLVARSQLNTSHSKADTYIAMVKAPSRFVPGAAEGAFRPFVKGPYTDEARVGVTLALHAIKGRLGLPAVKCLFRLDLVPDLLETPLGSRCKTGTDRALPFVVASNLLDEDPIPTVRKESQVWPLTTVVDWSKVSSCRHFSLGLLAEEPDGPAAHWYVLFVLFRYIFGVPDYADRNFVVKGPTVYSLDEDQAMRPKGDWGRGDLVADLKKAKSLAILEWLEPRKGGVWAQISEWEEALKAPAPDPTERKLAAFARKRLPSRAEDLLEIFRGA